MPPATERRIQLVHHVPGRTRFRLSWLQEAHEEARQIATQLAERAGVLEVRVQPRTGSVLCLHEPALGVDSLLEELRRITGVGAVLRPGEKAPPPVQAPARGSSVGGATIGFFRDLDRDVRRVTEGRLDLATVAVAAFAGIGTVNTVVAGELPIPPWYSMAWWSFRVLATVEAEALESRRGAPRETAAEATPDGTTPPPRR